MNKKWLLAVITVLGVVYPKMSLSKISQRTHEKFCDVTFTHHVLSKFSRENGGDLIENATYSYFIEGRKNPVVEINGDSATARCYLLLMNAGSPPTFMTSGIYSDELTKTDQGWRFTKRTVSLDS